jgi:hypothetical protein
VPGFGSTPREEGMVHRDKNARTVPSFFFLHFIRPLELRFRPHPSSRPAQIARIPVHNFINYPRLVMRLLNIR